MPGGIDLVTDWFMSSAGDDEAGDNEAGPAAALRGPPDDQLPGVVPLEVVLGRSPEAAVLLTGVRAFPSGLAMVLGIRLRQPVTRPEEHLWDDVFDHLPAPEPVDSTRQRTRLRWGFTFATGTSVSNVDARNGSMALHGGGGSGGDRSYDRDYWLTPLPPAGPLTLFCAWPRSGIASTTVVVDTRPILAAASRARALWPS